jgi:hypothetical protein
MSVRLPPERTFRTGHLNPHHIERISSELKKPRLLRHPSTSKLPRQRTKIVHGADHAIIAFRTAPNRCPLILS